MGFVIKFIYFISVSSYTTHTAPFGFNVYFFVSVLLVVVNGKFSFRRIFVMRMCLLRWLLGVRFCHR